jgi:site-specific DNA-methyltransferase (adenine-specific)
MFKYYFFLDWRKTQKVWRTEDGHSQEEVGAKLFDTKSQAELDFFALLMDNDELRKGEFIDITKGKKKAPSEPKKVTKKEVPQKETEAIVYPTGFQITERDCVKFVLGDNMEFMRKLKEEGKYQCFDIGIVDPPYGISVGGMNLGGTKDTVRDYKMGSWDDAIPDREYFELLDYVCKDWIIWGGNYFVSELTRNGRCFVVWDKMTRGLSFADGELALTTFDRSAIIIGEPRNKKRDDSTKKRHPTQKPVYLYDFLHLKFAEKGYKVLDTHGGSHSHAIAAYKNNIELTIIERDESYYKSGIAAFDQEFSKNRIRF